MISRHDDSRSGVDQPKTTVSQIFGEIVWVMSQSVTHKRFFISDLEWLVMPPILLNQFKIYRANERPAGVALWAKLSSEIEERIKGQLSASDAVRLAPTEWNSGDNLWLMEIIALGDAAASHQIRHEILKDITSNVFPGKPFKTAVGFVDAGNS